MTHLYCHLNFIFNHDDDVDDVITDVDDVITDDAGDHMFTLLLLTHN